MGRGRRIVSLKGRRGRRRIRLEDESSDGSDEEYVVGEEGESDGDSVAGEESCDSRSGMRFRGKRELEVEQRNSSWVSRSWEEEEEARKGLESKQRGAFSWRRKRSCRKSRVFNGKVGCEREVDGDKDWNFIQEKPRKSFSGRRNLEADLLCGFTRVEGKVVPTASQLKPIKEFLGHRDSSAVESHSLLSFLDDEDEVEAVVAQSKAYDSSVWGESRAPPSPCINRVSEDDDDFTMDADGHAQNQKEEQKDRKRKMKRRATACSNSHCTNQISSHVDDMGSEETGDSTTETVGFGNLTASLRKQWLNRLPVDVSWNHLRQKRSARRAHSVHTVSDHEAVKLNEGGHFDDAERHWVRKRKRVQLPLSAGVSAVGSSDAISVENAVLTADQKNRQRRKRQIVLYSDSESEDSGSSNTATKGTILQEDEDLSREANGCENFTTCLSSPVSRRLQVGPSWSSLRRKRFMKKGARKEAAGVQVCGICLSEEHNDDACGMLDSCSHYFCLLA